MRVNTLVIVVTCFLITLAIVPVIKKVALHIGAVDIPNKRKVHSKPMPRLGGLAIYIGFLIGYMLFAKPSFQMLAILIGSFFVVLIGAVDDINPLPPRIKFAGQLLAAATVIFYGKILLTHITLFGIIFNFGIFTIPITLFFILGCINCLNFIDGLDGLSAGVSSIFFLTVGIIALFINNSFYSLDVSLTFIMLGSTLGFLVHNFYPSSIFMGDSGAMFLGYIISITALLGFKNVTLTSFITPLLLLAVPILDTFFAIVRRWLRNQPISKPDKYHTHHQLMNRFGHRNAVLAIYFINGLFAIASIIYTLQNRFWGRVIYVILFLFLLWFVVSTSILVDPRWLKWKIVSIFKKDKVDSEEKDKEKNKDN